VQGVILARSCKLVTVKTQQCGPFVFVRHTPSLPAGRNTPGLHVECPIIFSDLNKISETQQIFFKFRSIKLQEYPSSGSRSDILRTDGRMYGRTDRYDEANGHSPRPKCSTLIDNFVHIFYRKPDIITVDRRVTYPVLLSDFNQIWILSQSFFFI
jgi:hypothetical protein